MQSSPNLVIENYQFYVYQYCQQINDKAVVQLRDHWGNDVAVNGVLGRARPGSRLDIPGLRR